MFLTVNTKLSKIRDSKRTTPPRCESPSSILLRRRQNELDNCIIEHPSTESISKFQGTDGTFAVFTDKKACVLATNQDFTTYTGFTLKQLIGKNCNILQHRFDQRNGQQLQLIRTSLTNLEPITTHLINYTFNEAEFLTIISVRPVFVQSVHIGFYSVQTPALWVSVCRPLKPSTPSPTPVNRRLVRSDKLDQQVRPVENVKMSAFVLKRYKALSR